MVFSPIKSFCKHTFQKSLDDNIKTRKGHTFGRIKGKKASQSQKQAKQNYAVGGRAEKKNAAMVTMKKIS